MTRLLLHDKACSPRSHENLLQQSSFPGLVSQSIDQLLLRRTETGYPSMEHSPSCRMKELADDQDVVVFDVQT